MCSQVDNLQKKIVCYRTPQHFYIDKQTNTKAAAPRSTSGLYSLGIPLSRLPNNLCILLRFWYALGRIDHSPYHSRESAVKKQILYRFIFMTETALLVPLSIMFCKIILCKNNISSKILEKYFFILSGAFNFHILLFRLGMF